MAMMQLPSTPGQPIPLTPLIGRERAILLVAAFSVPGLPAPASSPAPILPLGVSAVVLADDFASDVAAGPVTLELGQVTLAPRDGMMVSSANGPTLIALDAGQPEVTVWGRALRRRGRDDMSVPLKSATLTPGDGILLHPGSQLAIQNGAPDTLRALVLAIRPADQARQ